MTARPLRFSQLPLELSTKILLPHAKPGEPIMVLLLSGIGNLTTYRMQGRTNRVFRFDWDRQLQCHALRIPHSLWVMDGLALAKEALDQRLMLPVLINVEMESANEIAQVKTPPAAPPPTPLASHALSADAIKAELPARVSALAEKFHSTPEAIRSLIQTEDSGMMLKSGGWAVIAQELAV